MKFPQRTETHVTETESWRLLQSLAPKEWIIREVSERDYGIDAYIEIVSEGGQLTGQLISVQLKGVQNIEWSGDGKDIRVSRSPSVKTSTANYWFGLQVPVFLFLADLSAGNVYFVAVKEGIRSQYDKLQSQDSLSFKITDKLDLKSQDGPKLLRWLYARERLNDQFTFHITNLISQMTTFRDFIEENQGRDRFMEVEAGRHLQFRALYESCRMASLCLDGSWPLESLSALYKKDREDWKDDYCHLHEQTLDYALQEIEKLFPVLIRKALMLVGKEQIRFWLVKDPIFYNLCSNGELFATLKQIEDETPK